MRITVHPLYGTGHVLSLLCFVTTSSVLAGNMQQGHSMVSGSAGYIECCVVHQAGAHGNEH